MDGAGVISVPVLAQDGHVDDRRRRSAVEISARAGRMRCRRRWRRRRRGAGDADAVEQLAAPAEPRYPRGRQVRRRRGQAGESARARAGPAQESGSGSGIISSIIRSRELAVRAGQAYSDHGGGWVQAAGRVRPRASTGTRCGGAFDARCLRGPSEHGTAMAGTVAVVPATATTPPPPMTRRTATECFNGADQAGKRKIGCEDRASSWDVRMHGSRAAGATTPANKRGWRGGAGASMSMSAPPKQHMSHDLARVSSVPVSYTYGPNPTPVAYRYGPKAEHEHAADTSIANGTHDGGNRDQSCISLGLSVGTCGNFAANSSVFSGYESYGTMSDLFCSTSTMSDPFCSTSTLSDPFCSTSTLSEPLFSTSTMSDPFGSFGVAGCPFGRLGSFGIGIIGSSDVGGYMGGMGTDISKRTSGVFGSNYNFMDFSSDNDTLLRPQ
ncbi:hypothetical protein AYI69_g6961 [Smittium culicis]|uniref:Uncharacterized protein n=1 Tax=Smittium culicis TaxID=133412 RepID=A0A1R1XVE1_9FUNG|nr:hypothetical protein AYI69_g6961 [Smittium culicis]